MKSDRKEICCICGKLIKGYGHNPYPVKETGLCCDECNHFNVVPARMKQIVMMYQNVQNPTRQ